MQETPCEFPAARGNNGIADGRACLWALRKANKKTPAALGDACVEMLSDMGSIPITFTRKHEKNPAVPTAGFFCHQSGIVFFLHVKYGGKKGKYFLFFPVNFYDYSSLE